MEVTNDIGRGNECESNEVRISQLNKNPAPKIQINGRIFFVSLDFTKYRTICGIIIPTNPIGPQNAVTAPVRIEENSNIKKRIEFTLTPKLFAKSSPNDNTVICFEKRRIINEVTSVMESNKIDCKYVEVCNEPIDHRKNACN